MGIFADKRLRSLARLRYATGIACLFAYAAAADPDKPPVAKPGSRVMIEEPPPSRIIYMEEGGGLITPIAKPPPGSIRQQDPLPPINTASPLAKPRPPVARSTPLASKTRLGNATVPAPSPIKSHATLQVPPTSPIVVKTAPAAPVAASTAKSAEELALARHREYDALVTKLAAESVPPAERARRIETAAGPQIEFYQDAPVATQLGWLWIEGNEPVNAAQWFQRARVWHPGDQEATRGLAIASLAGRSYPAAIAIAEELPAGTPARSEVQREGWIGIGQNEYGQGHYGNAMDAFNRAATAGELPRHVQMLREWSRLKMGGNALAAANFGQLYRESPDLESAQGLLAAAPDSVPIDARTASTEPLASMLRARTGENAFRGHRYMEARALDPDRWQAIGAPGTINAIAAAGRREKTGAGGLGKLTAEVAPGGDLSIPLGQQAAVSLSSNRMRLNAGERAADAIVGRAPVGITLPASGAPIRATVRESQVSLRLERKLAWVASAGNGVAGGAVEARPVGSLAVFANPQWGQMEARTFAEPVRESILSWAGMTDPHGGPAWGGVHRLGADARALYLGTAPYSVGLYARAERLVGTGVAGNSRRALDISAGRDLGLPGFAYSSIGLNVGIDGYRQNLSHYTLGHGGYFSPQSYRKAGMAFDFMTKEEKSWLIRGRVSAARTWKREDAAPFFPLAPDGRSYEGSHTKGHEAAARLSAVVQVSPRVQVGLMLGRSISPQFSEKLALLEMRVLFEPRRGVVSADLPVARGE